MWAAHPGPMLADWLGRYHMHPVDNTLPDDEQDLLTAELISDPTSRTYAALSGGIALDVWAAVKAVGLLASLTGSEIDLPAPQVREQGVAPEELAVARARLRRYSAIAHLPEE